MAPRKPVHHGDALVNTLIFTNGLAWVAFALLLISGALMAACCALPGLLAGGAAVWFYHPRRQGGHVAKRRTERL